jgi:excisionase family DNA binding protein
MSGYLTIAEVADELRLSPRTILRWVDCGEIQAVRLPGGRLRIATSELALRVGEWSTITADQERGGPAVREHPGPGTGG